MSRNVGVWVDHKRAVIVALHDGLVETTTLDSDLRSHPHYTSSATGQGEKKYEQRYDEQLKQFYEKVIGECGTPKGLLILGPGEARRQLRTRIDRVPALSAMTVDIEAAGSLTDAQVVAAVKTHFGVAL